MTSGSATRLLVNDRADIAAGVGADGVHLTTRSIDAAAIRETFGDEFLIGVSTHSFDEAVAARDGGADFVVFGPIFATTSKEQYGAPVGVEELSRAAHALDPFPVIGLGGITAANAQSCLNAGASGVAGISIFGDHEALASVIDAIKRG